MRQARFAFEDANVSNPAALREGARRLAWLLFALLRDRQVTYADFNREFAKEKKTYQRDVAKLATLGTAHGFLVQRTRSGIVRLLSGPELAEASAGGSHANGALKGVFEALGSIVMLEAAPPHPAAAGCGFLTLAAPRLIEGTSVARTYADLRAAYAAKARVRFRYPERGETGTNPKVDERTVEPHLVAYYDGRYYLVAYDGRPKTSGWRQFAIDRIVGGIGRAGTFAPREIPQQYRGTDAIGLFKSGPSREVTIALSARIATAIEARRWQNGQVFTRDANGSATITLSVHDLGEAVRWALSFAPEASVVSPPEAVALERSFIASIALRHEPRTVTRSA